jgi:hypothetical protein
MPHNVELLGKLKRQVELWHCASNTEATTSMAKVHKK